MKDLTDGPIAKNILQMALPIAAGMFFQTLYFLIDLYFVAGLGDAALAGVGAAGNVMFIVLALTQVLGVGTVALISHAVGRKDRADAGLVFNQSLAFATAPIVGQNYGARKFARVRESFIRAVLIGSGIMLALTIFCRWGAAWAVGAFTVQPAALAVGTQYLQVISWNFVATGIVFTCSAVFQGLGNTVPAVLSSASRLITFVVPSLWLAESPNFQPVELWYVSVASVTLQALLSLWLVRREFRNRMPLATTNDLSAQPSL